MSALTPELAALIDAHSVATSRTMVLRRSRFTTGRGFHELQVLAYLAGRQRIAEMAEEAS